VKIEEVQKWRPFLHPDGKVRDLSFLDAHQVAYTHKEAGKPDQIYTFFVTYSCHCFTKDYENQTDEEKEALMYVARREDRPFCERRYKLAKLHLRTIVETLGARKVIHAGYGSYAVIEVDLGGFETAFYFVAFKAFREQKKFRLHITSAYPITERQRGKAVNFFAIARNLRNGKPLPFPPK